MSTRSPARRLVRWLRSVPVAFWALLLFIFTIPWEDAVVVEGMGTFSRVAGMAALAAAAGGSLRRRTFRRGPAPGILLVFAYVGWVALTFYWTPPASRFAFDAIVTLLQLLAMVWLIYDQCDSPARLRLALQAYLAGAVVTIGLTLWAFFITVGSAGRAAPEGFNPNAVAYAVALGIPMAAYLAFRQRPWLLAYVPAAWCAVLMTGSRGGLVAGLVATASIGSTGAPVSRRRRVAAVVLVAAGVWVAALVAPDEVVERFAQAPAEVSAGEFSGRGDFWAAGLEAFAQKPFIGHGIATSREAIGAMVGTPRSAHNTWLTILIEQGVIGFVLLMSCFLVPLERARLLPALERRLMVILCATIGAGTLVRDMENDKPLWLVLALLLAFAASWAAGWSRVGQDGDAAAAEPAQAVPSRRLA